MNFPGISVVAGSRPNKLNDIIFNLFIKLNVDVNRTKSNLKLIKLVCYCLVTPCFLKKTPKWERILSLA